MEIKKILVMGDFYSVTRVSESAIVVNKIGKDKSDALFAGFLRDFKTQRTQVSRWDKSTGKMASFKLDAPVHQYQLSLAKVTEIVRQICQRDE